MLAPDLDKIPPALKAFRQWVCYKPNKVPVNPKSNDNARADDPDTWGEFDQAVRHWEAHRGNGIAGVGFEFSPGDPYAGIDLDKCRHPETGEIEPWALEIVRHFNSYTEVSPSGTGLHIWIKGKLPPGGRHKGKIEMYDTGRYFTVTGHHLEGTPTTIEARQTELEALHKEVFGKLQTPPKNSDTGTAMELSDFALIDKALNAPNRAKFAALWAGDTSAYASPSEADLALCSLLAFWTGPDPARIDRLFRESGLYRKKWERQDYRDRTITKALTDTTEFYNPGHAAGQAASSYGVATGGGIAQSGDRGGGVAGNGI